MSRKVEITDEEIQICKRAVSLLDTPGLTQEKFAESIDLSRGAITSWKALKNVPTIKNLKKISDVYGVSLKWLQTGAGSKYSNVTQFPDSSNATDFPEDLLRESLVDLKGETIFITLVHILEAIDDHELNELSPTETAEIVSKYLEMSPKSTNKQELADVVVSMMKEKYQKRQ